MSEISIAEKEHQFYFYYLLLLTAGGLLLLSFIFLRKMDSPFTNNLALEMHMLDNHKKMDDRQNEVNPYLVKVFDQIDALPIGPIQASTKTDILGNIENIRGFATDGNLNDARKENYLLVADFLQMYFNDKNFAATELQNIALYKTQCTNCNIGFNEKKEQLIQKNAAINARSH